MQKEHMSFMSPCVSSCIPVECRVLVGERAQEAPSFLGTINQLVSLLRKEIGRTDFSNAGMFIEANGVWNAMQAHATFKLPPQLPHTFMHSQLTKAEHAFACTCRRISAALNAAFVSEASWSCPTTVSSVIYALGVLQLRSPPLHI